jgi:protein required for attachment to host cells
MSKETWIIAANSTIARVFRLDKLELIEMETLINPEGRLHDRELGSDKPGRGFDSVGSGRSAYTKSLSLKESEIEAFAKKLANYIEHARSSGQIDRVFIAANPAFLGSVRSSLSHNSESIVAHSIDKDITGMKPNEILGYFPIGL